MVREAERKAFAKACAYLNYNASAKWFAILAAAGIGVTFVALLVILWMFAELMVSRGKIPDFTDLTAAEQMSALQQWQEIPSDQYRDLLIEVGMPEPTATATAAVDLARATPSQKEWLWRAYLYQLLEKRVSPEAAHVVAGVPADVPLNDHGILSLVVRRHVGGRLNTPLISWLARWNPWMWRQHGDPPQNFVSYLTILLIIAIVLALLHSVLTFLNREMAARATIEASSRLRRAVYHHTFRLGTLAFRALGPSEAVSIFTRHIEAIHEALYIRLTVVFREPIKFCLLLTFALVLNFWLALAFLLFAMLVWLIGGQVAAYFRRQGRIVSNQAAEQLSLIRESLMLMRLVKTYMMELFNQSRVERLLTRYAKAQMARFRGEAIYQPLLIFLGALAAMVLLYVTGLIVLYGQLGVASAITLVTALVSLYWPMERWLDHRRFLRRGWESAAILFKFLERPGEVGQVVGAEFLPPLRHQIEFDNVSLREPGSTRMLLQNVTLTIKSGQRIGLVGSNDLELHALVYLLVRLLDPTHGEIRIDDHNLRWVTLDSLRNQISIVLQNNLVFHDTVANNIGCGDPAFTLPQIIEAAKIAHAHHFIQKLPKGYETAIGELGHSLSSSEQFRIGLARAILRDPAIVIIEEATGVMDEDMKSLLDDTLTRFLPGRTTLFLPHRISTIRSCNRIFLLHNGQIEAVGDHRELLAQNQLYRHLHYLEFNEMVEQV